MSGLREELEPIDEVEDEIEDVSEGGDGAGGDQENDADLDGGEESGEDEELGQPGEGPAQRQDVRPSRARGRAERLSRQLAEERTQRGAERAEFQRQLADINARLSQPSAADRAMQEVQERERVALMAPEERIAYEVGKVRNEVRQELQRTNFINQTASDATQFRSVAATDPLARKYETRVDAMARDLEARGQFVPRDMILSKLVGDEVRAKAQRERTKQARSGRQRVSAQTTRPGNGRADSSTPPRRGGNDYQAVLERLKEAVF